MTRDEYNELIQQKQEKDGYIQEVWGALGDVSVPLVVEEYDYDREPLVKFFGISYWYRGWVVKNKTKEYIDAAAQLKRTLMATARFVLRVPFVIPILLFNKYHILDWIVDVHESDLHHKQPKFRDMSGYAQAFIEALCDIFDLPYVLGTRETGRDMTKWRNVQLHRLIYCLASLIDADKAYGWRYQDAIVDAKNFNEFAKTLLEREKAIHKKLKKLVRLVKIILFFSPVARKLEREFFKRFDRERTRMTEGDFYFTLRREGYDYGGMEYPQRLRIAEGIDKELGHFVPC